MLHHHGEREDNPKSHGDGHSHGKGQHGCILDVPVLVENMKWKTNETVLDYGCGVGQNGMQFVEPIVKKNNSKMFAIDNAAVAVEKAKIKYPDHSDIFFCGDILDSNNWPLNDQKFDKVIAVHSLQYMENIKDFFIKIHAQLNDGGQVGASMPFGALVDLRDMLAEFPNYGNEIKEIIPTQPNWAKTKASIDWLREIIIDNGFSISYWEVIPLEHTFKDMDQLHGMWTAMLDPVISKMTEDEKEQLKKYMIDGTCRILNISTDTTPVVVMRDSLRFVADKI